MSDLKNISPEVLSEFVNFYRDSDKKDWDYTQYAKGSMQEKQAAGAAFLFNMLNEKGFALLADEVGMGKTIQALAVCAALWKQKPNAKILVLAPRNEVAQNWLSEYNTFISVHYRQNDDLIKSRIGNEPINPAHFCRNLYELIEEVQKDWRRLYVGKISSFSALLSRQKTNERLVELGIEPDQNYDYFEDSNNTVTSIANQLRKEASNHLNDGSFDLMIIDEAHYFRNKYSGSLRSSVASAFFGKGKSRLAKRVLLLTATPNHSSSDNIKAITSYFNPGLAEKNFTEILDEICVRRYRRLSKRGLMKYNYRREIPRESGFENNKLAALFFGIYQKQLVIEYMRPENKRRRSSILGFLEGTESIPHTREPDSDDADNLKEGVDYKSGTDADMLIRLAAKYKDVFNDYPAHPKYEQLIADLIPDSTTLKSLNDKKLVFVRRIPSVREIANRTIHQYDLILLRKISKALGSNLELDRLTRHYYERKIKSLISPDMEGDDEGEDTELEITDKDDKIDIEGVPNSKVLDLFKRLKKQSGVVAATHASKFRLNFSRSRYNPFSLFFSPGKDYHGEGYRLKEIARTIEGKKGPQDNIYTSCLLRRLDNSMISNDITIQLKHYLVGKRLEGLEFRRTNLIQLDTLLTIYWNYLDNHEEAVKKDEVIKKYEAFSPFQKEALSIFLEKGILLASSALIDIYCAFIVVKKRGNPKGIKLYQKFTHQIEKQFSETALPEIITKSILNFNVLCEKVFTLATPEKLINYPWKNFFDAQPAYPYSAATKNKRVMASFNTPFFPDVLISTSVLQEGVNLQYFCDQVIHYGVAWTPGDNEQRVGRVDRMFSKVERKLEMGDATLDIQYPYLKNTIDEDHVANFIRKKYFEENLIDKCHAISERTSFSPTELSNENWSDYFRTPKVSASDGNDPYPVRDLGFKIPSYSNESSSPSAKIEAEIMNTFIGEGVPTYESRNQSDVVCVLDPTLQGGRKQPVIVRMIFSAPLTGLSGDTIYTLRLITPLGTKKEHSKFSRVYTRYQEKYENECLTVKMCLNEEEGPSSMFGLYMKVEIPVFVNRADRPLSSMELVKNFRMLTDCADFIEEQVTTRDLSMDDQIDFNISPSYTSDDGVLREKLKSDRLSTRWENKGPFVYLFKERRSGGPWAHKTVWQWNHDNSFVKYYVRGNSNRMILPYSAEDIQSIEASSLERVFDYHLEKSIWKNQSGNILRD